MDISRLSRGQLVAGASALLLFIFMFFSWFSIDFPGNSVGFSGWDALGWLEVLLLLLAIVAGVAFAAMAFMAQSPRLPVAPAAIVAGLGIVAVLLVVIRLIDPVLDLDRSIGLFLGLIAAAGIAFGGFLGMQESGTTFAGEADRLRSGGGSAAGPRGEEPARPAGSDVGGEPARTEPGAPPASTPPPATPPPAEREDPPAR